MAPMESLTGFFVEGEEEVEEEAEEDEEGATTAAFFFSSVSGTLARTGCGG